MVVERTVTEDGTAVGAGVSGIGAAVGAGAFVAAGEGSGDGTGEDTGGVGVCKGRAASASRERSVSSARTGTAPEASPQYRNTRTRNTAETCLSFMEKPPFDGIDILYAGPPGNMKVLCHKLHVNQKRGKGGT